MRCNVQVNDVTRGRFISVAWLKVNEEAHSYTFWAGYEHYVTAIVQHCVLSAEASTETWIAAHKVKLYVLEMYDT